MVDSNLKHVRAARPSGHEPIPVDPTRQKILGILEEHPGATIQRVANEMGFSHTTAQYHLTTLARAGLAGREKEGRVVRHYSTARRPALVDRIRPVVQAPASYALLQYLAENPVERMTLNQVARDLGLYHGYVRRCLEQLDRLQVLRLGRGGSRYTIHTNCDLKELLKQAQERYLPDA